MATQVRVDPRIERTRAAVVEAAVALLLDGGTKAVTIEAVVQRSGVARSTIYRHWPTRTDVVAAAFEAVIPPLPADVPDGPLRERLEALLVPVAEHIGREEHAAIVPALLADAGRDPELRSFRDRFIEMQRAPLRGLVQTAVQRGELPGETDPDEAIAQLAGPILFRRVVLGQPVDAAFARRMVELFLVSRGAAG
jgi:AcrR family transcriptional regulator